MKTLLPAFLSSFDQNSRERSSKVELHEQIAFKLLRPFIKCAFHYTSSNQSVRNTFETQDLARKIVGSLQGIRRSSQLSCDT